MARPRVEFEKDDVRWIVSAYKKGMGMVEIGAEYELSAAVIRRVLVDAGVKLRGRGRPRKVA